MTAVVSPSAVVAVRSSPALYALRCLMFAYFLLIGFTQVENLAASDVSSRIVPADWLALGLLLIGGGVAVLRGVRLESFFISYAALVVTLAVSAIFARDTVAATNELIVYVYCGFVAFAMYQIFSRLQLPEIVRIMDDFTLASFILASVGILGFFGVIPEVNRAAGGLSGTFRNTGQAGTFFGLALAIAIPRLITSSDRKGFWRLLVCGVLCVALALTVKRAAMIGVLASFGLMLMFLPRLQRKAMRQVAALLGLGVCLLVAWRLLILVSGHNDNLAWRLHSKIYDFQIVSMMENFYAANVGGAINAFKSSPILGVGLGNTAGYWTGGYEVHSTYLSVLATGGLLGAFAYLVWMGGFVRVIWRGALSRTASSPFLIAFGCFLLGNMVAWAYTLHVRKREFWVVAALALAYGAVHRAQVVRQAPARRSATAPVRTPGRPGLR